MCYARVARKIDGPGRIFCRYSQFGQAFARLFKNLRHLAGTGDFCSDRRDGAEADAETADVFWLDPLRQKPPEQSHREHSMHKDIREADLLRQPRIELDRIMISG